MVRIRELCVPSIVFFMMYSQAFACELQNNLESALRQSEATLHKVINTCAEKSFDFTKRLPNGKLPFREIVATRTDPQAVHLMLQAGANPNATNERGSPAVVDAINFVYDADDPAFLEMLDILGDAGADFSRPDDHGALALNMAVGKGKNQLVALLLKHGADPNGLNTYNRTALFSSVFGRCNPVGGHMLIEAGASLETMPDDQVARMFDEARKTCASSADGRGYISDLEALLP